MKIYLMLALFVFAPYSFARKSPLREILPHITNIKSQEGRNTCTIFTTVAALETLYLQRTGARSINFSEEWIQYLASTTNASGGARGSMVSTDFRNAKRWGLARETTMPYTEGEWKGEERRAKQICGDRSDHSTELLFTRCLYGKRPSYYLSTSESSLKNLPGGIEFSAARSEAATFKDFVSGLSIQRLYNPSVIKDKLDQLKSLTLEINIFHGSWNTGYAETNGIGRDRGQYSKGTIGYPEHGSKDRQISPRLGHRHAVQIVGYDDEKRVRYKLVMQDGSTKTFERKGVYIFKNSWGTQDFGKDFRYDGMRIRGFGMIPQDHVHEFGLVSIIN